MDAFAFVIDFILHIDRHLQVLGTQYVPWVYAILFIIVFCETGLVLIPGVPTTVEFIRMQLARRRAKKAAPARQT
jgi:membrane protein DedA with SNARE-associated domain